MKPNTILAFDGHDGSGKTTLSKMMAERLDAKYVRPFGGENGINLIRAAEDKDYPMTLEIGMNSIREIEESYNDSVLVFDRHWMTVLSLVPRSYWPEWSVFPPTVLCWADLETTKSRLALRDEEKFDDDYHSFYLKKYVDLKEYRSSELINTGENDIQSCIKKIEQWLKKIKIFNLT